MKRQRAVFLILGIAIALIIAALILFSHEAIAGNNWHLPSRAIISQYTDSLVARLWTLYEITFN